MQTSRGTQARFITYRNTSLRWDTRSSKSPFYSTLKVSTSDLLEAALHTMASQTSPVGVPANGMAPLTAPASLFPCAAAQGPALGSRNAAQRRLSKPGCASENTEVQQDTHYLLSTSFSPPKKKTLNHPILKSHEQRLSNLHPHAGHSSAQGGTVLPRTDTTCSTRRPHTLGTQLVIHLRFEGSLVLTELLTNHMDTSSINRMLKIVPQNWNKHSSYC